MTNKDTTRTLPTAASSADSRLIPAKHVLTAVHGTRTVLLDSKGGRFYGLDDVGARIWSLSREGRTTEQIIEAVANEFDSDRATIVADVTRLLADLQTKRLLEEE
jgi:hypothetical protein